MADNINKFKNHLDKFFSSYDFVYLFTPQPLETKVHNNFIIEPI